MSERGAMLGGEFRYIAGGNSGTFNFDYLAHDARVGDEERQYNETLPSSRWWYQWKDTSSFGSDWAAAVNINRVSDPRYFEDFGRGLYTSAISFLPSSAYLNGHGDWWTASIGGDQYQITDPTLSEQYAPYRRLPRALFTAEHSLLGDLSAGINSEFVAFSKNQALDGQRLDLFPYLAYPIETAAYFIRPQLGYRYTAYNLDHLSESSNPLLTRQHPHNGVPIFSLDTGLVFERELHFRRPGVDADAGTARLLPARAVPQPVRPAGVRHAGNSVHFGRAVPQQPLRRRRPADGREQPVAGADHALPR